MNEEEFVSDLIDLTGGTEQSLIGDDCAIIDEFSPALLATLDAMVGQVHFDESFSAHEIGQKLSAVNISDIAAMGGTPEWALLNINSSHDDEWYFNLIEGVIDRLDEHDASLVGGDISSTASSTHHGLSLTMLGRAHAEGILKRSGAEPGDCIAVSGALGRTGAILSEQTRTEDDRKLLTNFPDQVDYGKKLVKIGITCAIDVSDGLLKDLRRVCNASGVGARINVDDVPIHEKARSKAENSTEALQWALTGGEDFLLLFAIPETVRGDSLPEPVHEIGTFTDEEKFEWEPSPPSELNLDESGYDHFTG